MQRTKRKLNLALQRRGPFYRNLVICSLYQALLLFSNGKCSGFVFYLLYTSACLYLRLCHKHRSSAWFAPNYWCWTQACAVPGTSEVRGSGSSAPMQRGAARSCAGAEDRGARLWDPGKKNPEVLESVILTRTRRIAIPSHRRGCKTTLLIWSWK